MAVALIELEPWVYAALTATGVLTGFIDAIAGGGGLIMMPALLSTGLPPHIALGTNKLQSSMGVAMAARTFHAKGLMVVREYRWTVLVVLIAAALGGLAVQAIDAKVLGLIVPVLLLFCSAYVIFSPRMDDGDSHHRLSLRGYAPVAGAIGFYDGFFGPGAGSFYATSAVALRGLGLTRATALTKLFNVTSNVGSLMIFAMGGKVIWLLGLCIGLGSMAGSYLGTHSAIHFGARLIRPLLVIISIAMTGRLLWTYFSG